MGKGKTNKMSSKERRLKKHMQKTLGFETFSDRVRRKLKLRAELLRIEAREPQTSNI